MVSGVVNGVKVLVYLLQKFFLVVVEFIILFNLVLLEAWYHGQLVFLQEDLGQEVTSAIDANKLDDVRLLTQLLFSFLVLLKPSLSLLEPELLPEAS